MAGEPDGLVFLANVALHNYCSAGPVFCRKKVARPRELKIMHVNGSNIAELDDLKNLPMSVLFQIFVEKFEDTSRRCTVFVCKFGLRNVCNTKFMDVKENKIHRLENLVQCHLLEHLLKTKSGSLVEIPKKSFEKFKTTTSMGSMIEVDNSTKPNSSCFKNDQNATKNINNFARIVGKRPVCRNVRPSNPEDQTIVIPINLANNDHTYATTDAKKLINSTSSSEECQLMRSNIVNINELFPSNGGCSEELSSFMIYETLHQPTNIFIIDGTKLIVEKLPIVGSEVEVSTNCDISVTEHFTPSADTIRYKCTFCTSSYPSKKSLNLHIRKKHSDSLESKTTKRKIDYNEAELVTCNSKARKIIQTPPTSENLNNDWSVDLKENLKINVNFAEKSDSSILKTALTKSQTMKRPVVNISNVWNNIHVQYI